MNIRSAKTDIAEVEAEWVEAIRSDERVGRGSCSSIDECFTDEELVGLLRADKVTTSEGALQAAYSQEGLFREKGLEANCDSGEPLDSYWTQKF